MKLTKSQQNSNGWLHMSLPSLSLRMDPCGVDIHYLAVFCPETPQERGKSVSYCLGGSKYARDV